MPSLVTEGSVIHVPVDALDGNDEKRVEIQWIQQFDMRSEHYYLCEYMDRSGGSGGMIFVQENKVEEFKAKHIDGDGITLKVDEKFQYGQDVTGPKRFLVYHDKEHRPQQHRFVGSYWSDMIASLGYIDDNTSSQDIKKYWADFLKDFSDQ